MSKCTNEGVFAPKYEDLEKGDVLRCNPFGREENGMVLYGEVWLLKMADISNSEA